MDIIFMGTPEFAVPILDILHSHHRVVLAVSQPDQFDQRKKKAVVPPVAAYASEHGIPLIQPDRIKDAVDIITSIPADLIVTAAYGQFVPKSILDHPIHKAINVHASLLPKYRGGAPIQRALMAGEAETGVSIIYMTPKMDGAILSQKKILIEDADTQATLFHKLRLLGREMILDVITALANGTAQPRPQDPAGVTFAPNLTKEDELIDFKKPAWEVFNQIRALNPNPGAYFVLDGMNIKVFGAAVAPERTTYPPGVIAGIAKDRFMVSCGENTVLAITELQLPGKNRMTTRDFLNGKGRQLIIEAKEIK